MIDVLIFCGLAVFITVACLVYEIKQSKKNANTRSARINQQLAEKYAHHLPNEYLKEEDNEDIIQNEELAETVTSLLEKFNLIELFKLNNHNLSSIFKFEHGVKVYHADEGYGGLIMMNTNESGETYYQAMFNSGWLNFTNDELNDVKFEGVFVPENYLNLYRENLEKIQVIQKPTEIDVVHSSDQNQEKENSTFDFDDGNNLLELFKSGEIKTEHVFKCSDEIIMRHKTLGLGTLVSMRPKRFNGFNYDIRIDGRTLNASNESMFLNNCEGVYANVHDIFRPLSQFENKKDPRKITFEYIPKTCIVIKRSQGKVVVKTPKGDVVTVWKGEESKVEAKAIIQDPNAPSSIARSFQDFTSL